MKSGHRDNGKGRQKMPRHIYSNTHYICYICGVFLVEHIYTWTYCSD